MSDFEDPMDEVRDREYRDFMERERRDRALERADVEPKRPKEDDSADGD